MKKRIVYLTFFIFACACIAPLWAEDAELKTIVDDFYHQFDQAIEAKNLDGVMDLISPEFRMLGTMAGKQHVKAAYQKLMEKHDQLRSAVTVDSIQKVESKIQIIGNLRLEGRKSGAAQWEEIINDGFYDVMKKEGDSYKVISSGQVVKERFNKIKGSTYKDETIGFSFSLPEDWTLLPIELTTMKDGVMFMLPSGHAPGFFGHVQIPYNVGAKQAIEGDDAVMKKIVKTFKALKSGPITVNELKGYESITRYLVPDSNEEMTRHRIYLSGGGLLYVFILNAPTKHWDDISGHMMEIVNTFSLTPEARTAGAARDREKSASGEIMDRIYSNDEYGCQIAAPKGWSIQSTPLGAFKISISIQPPEGNSLVRLLAIDTKGAVSLNDVFEQEMNGIQSITDDFAVQEEARDIELAGAAARTATFSFTLEGLGAVQRKSVMAIENDILYMILCDAIPPEKASEMAPSFDAIIQSFTLN